MTKENESYREQIRSLDSNEKDRQIEFLREMIRASEDALLKERNHSKRTQTKKDDRYKTLQNQVCLSFIIDLILSLDSIS